MEQGVCWCQYSKTLWSNMTAVKRTIVYGYTYSGGWMKVKLNWILVNVKGNSRTAYPYNYVWFIQYIITVLFFCWNANYLIINNLLSKHYKSIYFLFGIFQNTSDIFNNLLFYGKGAQIKVLMTLIYKIIIAKSTYKI